MSSAAAVTQPRAVALYTELVDLLDALLALHREGLAADVTPIVELVAALAEAIPEHGDVLQLLTWVRDHGKEPTPAVRQAAAVVDALYFGVHSGLRRRELLVLGTACAMATVIDSDDPDEAAGALVRYASLGGLGPDVFEAALLPHSLNEVDPADPVGRTFVLVDAWQRLRLAKSPPAALAWLAAGRVPRVSRALARQLALVFGAWPTGTVVRLNNDRLALVIGWAPGQRHGRPVVQPLLDDRTLGDPVDLADVPGLHVVEALCPAEEGIDLSALRGDADDRRRRHIVEARRGQGPSVSLSYELNPADAPSDEDASLPFDLSIDDSVTTHATV